MNRRTLCLIVAVLFSTAASTFAAPLNLSVDYPLVTADFLSVSYDADGAGANGLLTGTAFTTNYNLDGSGSVGLSQFGDFTVSIVINPATGFGISGSLLMTGDINNDTANEVLFSSNTLTDFGFGIDDKFEATFRSDGTGSLAGSSGSQFSVILDARQISQFNGPIEPFFTHDFGPSTGLKADVFVGPRLVPLPAAAWLAMPGILAVIARTRRTARAA